MSNYNAGVVGFLFDNEGQHVVLIQKKKPDWQAGKFNGVGGKIEPGEFPEVAMRREFWEETGVNIPVWEHFATLKESRGKDWTIYFFRAQAPLETLLSCTPGTTDERTMLFSTNTINQAIRFGNDVLPNLRWLIPMGLHINKDYAQKYEIKEA